MTKTNLRRAHVHETLMFAERHGYLPKNQWYWTSDGQNRKLSLGAHLFTLREAEVYCEGLKAVMYHLPMGRENAQWDQTSRLPLGTWLNR